MRTYVLKRLLLVPPTMLGITLICFLVMQMAPGDPAQMKVSPGVGGEQTADKSVSRDIYEKTLEQFDLDKPKHMQYVRWLGKLMGIEVEVWSAKKACRTETEAKVVELFTADNEAKIAAQREVLEKKVRADMAKQLQAWERTNEDDVLLAWQRLGTGDASKDEVHTQMTTRLEAAVPQEVDRQLGDWVQGQAKQNRHRYIEDINVIRQRYIAEYGQDEDFEKYFEYSGVSPNLDDEGDWYPLDFGKSFKDDREVLDVLLEKLPVSMELSLLSIFLAYLIAIPLGIHSSVSQGTIADQVITTILFILYSLPSFWVALMLLLYVSKGGVSNEAFQLFPVSGVPELLGDLEPGETRLERLLRHAHHLALPVACLTYGSFAYISRQMRAGMLDVIRSDYIRTARAKGLSERVVIFKHALRNSLIPILTIVAVILPALVGGSVIIETIFDIDGIGKLSFESILNRNYSVLMAIFTMSAFLTLIGILLSDLLYAVVDPQISFEGK